jgi:hypothetical protein
LQGVRAAWTVRMVWAASRSLRGTWTLGFWVVYWRIKQCLLFFVHKHITETTVRRKTVVQHSVIRLEFEFVREFSQDADFAGFYKLERRLLNGQVRELHNNKKLIDMTLYL